MAVNRFASRFNVRNDVFDSITPNFIRQKDISAPNGEWKPASWLPVQWTASNINAGEDAFVISGGKVVALDRQGFVIPAGYYWFCTQLSATSDVFVTYTSDDYDWGVTDIVTGDRYATDGTTSHTAITVAKALLERGLVTEAQATIAASDASLSGYSATDMITQGGTMTVDECKAVFLAFISKPVGFAAYDVYVYSGQPIDGDQWFTNYSKQQLIQFLTESQLIVPHRVADSTAADAFDASTIVTVSAAATTGDFPRPGEVWEGAALASVTRYAALGVTSTSGHVALALAQDDVAANTSRTLIECDVDGVLTRQKTSISSVSTEGDWYLDADVGVIIIHEDTWATLVAGSTTATLSYYFYAQPSSATDVASAHRYIHFDGLAVPGDDLGVDKQSNFVKKNASSDVLDGAVSLGKVLYCLSEPRTLLDKVKTAYNLSNMSASSKMPGTATAGYSDMVTLSQEDVADRLAILLVRI